MKEAAQLFSDLDLKVCSAHTDFPLPGAEGEAIVKNVQILGATRIISGFGPEELADEEAIKRAAELLQRSAEFVGPYGMSVGIHNHWWEFTPRVETRYGYDLLLELAPGAFSELDVFWAAHGDADPVEVIRRYQARLPLLHIKDGPLKEGRPHTAVGKGDLDIPPIIKAADPSVLEWLVVELDECATDMMEAVRESCSYLVSAGLGHGR